MKKPVTPIVRFGEIEDVVKSYYPDADLDLIRRAYVYSAQVHQGQTRVGGEPYLVHPVAVAKTLAQMKLDEAAIATGLLHDAVEDTLTTKEDLEERFGKEIAALVDGVTKISKMEFQSREERQAENFRKMILAMSRDIRVLLVKLADRLHNMRTLDPMPAEARKRIARETLDIYGPLAGRLGIYWMRMELEDLAFKYVDPERYEYIKTHQEELLKAKEEYANNVLRIVREKLQQYNMSAITKGRNKEIYSIHRKMISQNLDFEQIHDLTAFRIILSTESECYAVLGLIHSLWRPVPGRFKDYIAMPKGNRYQSLHTTVIGPEGKRIEIQIRTHEMDRVAEEGIAAHWSYKQGKVAEDEDLRVMHWLRQMMDWQQDLEDPREFLENVRVDLYPDEVYVFTPKGEVKEFPKGSTPLDFAYSIHTEVGHRCVGARVNGKMVPLKYELKNGDSVEIATSVNQRPSKDWLKYVRTPRARTKVRHFLMAEDRQHSVEMGKDSTERELKKWRFELSRVEKEGEVLKVAQEFGFKTEEDLYAAIGFGRVSAKVVVTRVVPAEEREKAKVPAVEEKPRTELITSRSGVKIEGVTDPMVNFAKCCNPLPGDAIRGFITRGRGVTIHKDDCANLGEMDRLRIIDVSWDGEQRVERIVGLSIQAQNRRGLLELISGVFASNDADIVQANIKTGEDDRAHGVFRARVRNLSHLTRLMNSLKNVKGVETVERLGTIRGRAN
jgi:GTP diphosphokinase / guanosine-3',5'-bis(diphosphate) 3'-diphosphatase